MHTSLRIHPISKLCINKHSQSAVPARSLAKKTVIWCINRLLFVTHRPPVIILPHLPRAITNYCYSPTMMNRRLTSACSAALIALLTLAGSLIVDGQDKCYPSDSTFSVSCECTTSLVSSERFRIECSTNKPLLEFPVLNNTYPLVVEM